MGGEGGERFHERYTKHRFRDSIRRRLVFDCGHFGWIYISKGWKSWYRTIINRFNRQLINTVTAKTTTNQRKRIQKSKLKKERIY